MKDNVSSYFASPIYYEDKPEFLEDLNKICQPYIDDSKANFKKETKRSEKDKNDFTKVYHSANLIDDPKFKFFIDYVGAKSCDMLNYMGFDLTHHTVLWRDLWVQEFTKTGGGHHRIHIHENSHISGFYFLENDKASFPLFHDPRQGAAMTALPEKDVTNISLQSRMINYQPMPGHIYMFPSYLPHEYVLSKGGKFRFIHFNIQAIPNYIMSNEGSV